MKYAQWDVINELAVKQVGKPAVYISNRFEFPDTVYDFIRDEVEKFSKADFFRVEELMDTVISGGLIFFEDLESARKFYNIFEQPLTYSGSIYAAIHHSDGTCFNENT